MLAVGEGWSESWLVQVYQLSPGPAGWLLVACAVACLSPLAFALFAEGSYARSRQRPG